jgi:hypothetical protein
MERIKKNKRRKTAKILPDQIKDIKIERQKERKTERKTKSDKDRKIDRQKDRKTG